MPKRLHPRNRKHVYTALVQRQGGEYCGSCSRRGVPLEIHHLDGDAEDWRPENLALWCRSCNAREGARRQQMRCDPEGGGGGERWRASYERRKEFGFEGGEAAHKSNLVYEPSWKKLVVEWCQKQGYIRKSDAVDGMAELLDCSTQTTERYWRKATSSVGWLERRADWKPYPVWVLRHNSDDIGLELGRDSTGRSG